MGNVCSQNARDKHMKFDGNSICNFLSYIQQQLEALLGTLQPVPSAVPPPPPPPTHSLRMSLSLSDTLMCELTWKILFMITFHGLTTRRAKYAQASNGKKEENYGKCQKKNIGSTFL